MSQREEIRIEGNSLENVIVKSTNGLLADVNKDYCICELRGATFIIKPENYRSFEVMIELARQIRLEAGIHDE